MLLVDTNIMIDYLRQKPLAIAFVNQYGKDNLALPPVVVMELFQGVLDKIDLQRTRKALNGFIVLDLDSSIARLAMQLQQQYILSHQLGIPDALIAATALIYSLGATYLQPERFPVYSRTSIIKSVGIAATLD